MWKMVMRALIGIALACIIFATLVEYSPKIKTVKAVDSEEIAARDMLNKMEDKNKNWMNITQDQYIEDFDKLYNEMQENYPYFNVVFRETGVNLDEEYVDYRKKIEVCTNDVDFYDTVREFINKGQGVGHLSLWGYHYMRKVEDKRQFIIQFPQYTEQYAPYLAKLDNPISRKNYQALQRFTDDLFHQVKKANEGLSSNSVDLLDENSNHEEKLNVETKILQEGKIAYVKINMFNMFAYSNDKDILLPFFESVSEYQHIIIDITDNYGGGMSYFNDLVVAPLITKPITVSTYMLIKGGENNREFLQIDEGLKKGTWKPIVDLPLLPKLNIDDLKQIDYFMQKDYTVKPLSKQQKYNGKIWLLVSSKNYSSSEYAAMFSQQSGFATLVGENTGGDGIGVDPAYIILPNSGLVVQYSPVYGITQDGKCSEEFGTMPDILSQNGESPLDTCLNAINSKR